MTESDAHAVASWRYPGVFAFYDAVADADDLAELARAFSATKVVCRRLRCRARRCARSTLACTPIGSIGPRRSRVSPRPCSTGPDP